MRHCTETRELIPRHALRQRGGNASYEDQSQPKLATCWTNVANIGQGVAKRARFGDQVHDDITQDVSTKLKTFSHVIEDARAAAGRPRSWPTNSNARMHSGASRAGQMCRHGALAPAGPRRLPVLATCGQSRLVPCVSFCPAARGPRHV